MNNQIFPFRIFLFSWLTASFFLSSTNAHAEELKSATITSIKAQVFVSKAGEKERSAVLQETIKSHTTISTGKNSHVELRFADQSIVRLGSNTLFSFNSKAREMNIQRGIALIYVPPHRGGAKIIVPTATATIHGDVIAVRCFGSHGLAEFVHLSPKDEEGPVTVVCTCSGEKQELGGGQLLRIHPLEPHLPRPVDISVAVFAHTSALLGAEDKKQITVTSSGINQLASNTPQSSTPPTSSTGGQTSTTPETNHPATNTNGTGDSDTTPSGGPSGSSGHDVTVNTGNTPVAGGTTVTANTPVTSGNTANSTLNGGSTAHNGTSGSSGNDVTVNTGNTPVAGGTTVTANTPVTSENTANGTLNGGSTAHNGTSGSSGHDITVNTGNTPVAGGTTVTANTPVTSGNTANSTLNGGSTAHNGTSGSSGNDVTVNTGNTPVAGGTTVTANTPVTSGNTANSTLNGGSTAHNGTSGSSGHDITVNTGSTPVAGGTTVTANTPVTNEGFATLSVDAQMEIIREETDQIRQVESGTLVVATSKPRQGTTVTASKASGTTALKAKTPVKSISTSVTPVDTSTALHSTTTHSDDAAVASDITLLQQAGNTAKSLFTQINAEPTHTSVLVEEEDAIEDVTETVLCTPTELVPCPNGQ